MDDIELTAISTENLLRFIKGKLLVDMPLFRNNPQNALKFDFECLQDLHAIQIVQSIVEDLIGEKHFWICQYGKDSNIELINGEILKGAPVYTQSIPYKSTSIDADEFVYCPEMISCNYVYADSFSIDNYIEHVFRHDFITNSIFLIDDVNEVAIWTYDRRGMDVASTNMTLLQFLYDKYYDFTSKYYREKMSALFHSST